MSLRDRLVAFIKGQDLDPGFQFKEDTSLIQSGVLDSLALFNLALWIEQQIDPQVDLTAFDLAKQWDTMADILRFIERHRRRMVKPEINTEADG